MTGAAERIFTSRKNIQGVVRMIKNTEMVDFKVFHDKWGHLVPVEENQTIPFEIRRV